jgi:ribosomal-protein-alanine N-acetyltransferase
MTAQALLRRMRWWDLPAVYEIERDLFPADPWSAAMFWSELAGAETRHYVVAVDDGDADGRIIGYAGLLASDADTADVQTLAVTRHHQRSGLGRALLADLLAEAARRGRREVMLEVRVDNDGAQALYRLAGFRPVAVRRGYYQPEGVDALVMTLDDAAAGHARLSKGVDHG